jgi:hypothetical protein
LVVVRSAYLWAAERAPGTAAWLLDRFEAELQTLANFSDRFQLAPTSSACQSTILSHYFFQNFFVEIVPSPMLGWPTLESFARRASQTTARPRWARAASAAPNPVATPQHNSRDRRRQPRLNDAPSAWPQLLHRSSTACLGGSSSPELRHVGPEGIPFFFRRSGFSLTHTKPSSHAEPQRTLRITTSRVWNSFGTLITTNRH